MSIVKRDLEVSDDESHGKKPRIVSDEGDMLSDLLMGSTLEASETCPCATCPRRVSKAVQQDWRNWVVVAQDEPGLVVMQNYFNMYVETGYGVSWMSNRNAGYYVLMCQACKVAFKKFFHGISTKPLEELPGNLQDGTLVRTELDKFAMKTIARLMCHQLAEKISLDTASSSSVNMDQAEWILWETDVLVDLDFFYDTDWLQRQWPGVNVITITENSCAWISFCIAVPAMLQDQHCS